MPLTMEQARDAASLVLTTVLAAESTYSSIPVLWDDVEGSPPVSAETSWLRFLMKHATGQQSSLTGALNKKRYTREGVIAIQVFTPVGDGRSTADALCSILQHAYEDATSPNGLWFRNVRVEEYGKSLGYQQTNVVADFEYDEVR